MYQPNSRSDISHCKNLYNRLDDEILKIVYPFRCVLYLFFTIKYRIRNNRIYPSGKLYRIFAFCWMLFLNSLCILRISNVEVRNNGKTKQLEYSILLVLCTGFFVTYFIEFTLMFIFDMINEENNILLILRIQNIHRSIGSRKTIQRYITWNWISVAIIIFSDFAIRVLYYISSYYPHFMHSVYDAIIDAMFIALDVNIVITMRILVLLRVYLNEWINNIKTMKADDEEYRKMFQDYKNILLAYDLFKTVYQAFVGSVSTYLFNCCEY
ncbi:hypothetical protein B5X24_HaOG201009 [Helicoverpa armigera]|nr:hypothetical protein B5X24_HaOG201009 [Helicoverpa armigera]